MKKLLIGAFLGIFAVVGIAILPNYADAQTTTTPPEDGSNNNDKWANPDAEGNLLKGNSTGDAQKLTGAALLDTISNAINWLLGILATIALVICLYGGFLMVTASGDEKKYEKGLTVLKYAGIGLAIIGLSWMIVSIVFWFVNNLSGGNQVGSQNVQKVSSGAGEGNFRK